MSAKHEGRGQPAGTTLAGRFELLSQLGSGSYGEVYEARDTESGARVALKLLRIVAADALLRFKREFRALTDLRHPNLVGLGELLEDQGQWFFTMELVRGPHLLEYVRGPAGCDARRLREALGQLCDGIEALHSAGKIHRDIKPGNLRVAEDGRVVILDLGLVAELKRPSGVTDGAAIGTPAYMAPEQGAGTHVGPPADWYALGAVLYEALCGQPPFLGGGVQVLIDKQNYMPEPPSVHTPERVCSDLESLCMQLLAISPKRRPGASVIRRVLGRASKPLPSASVRLDMDDPFVGRADALMALELAAARARKGEFVFACAQGPSGVGKSALVEEVAGRLQRRYPAAFVLLGRCYEAETVPYKAFDGAFDALSHALAQLDVSPCRALLPRRAALLVQMFPVLERVEAIAEAPRAVLPRDPSAHRAAAFEAVLELLARIGEQHGLVLVIDDLQWADTESLALLRYLAAAEPPAGVLVLATCRPMEEISTETQGALQHLLGRAGAVDLQLGGLDEHDAAQLVAALVGEAAPEPAWVELLVRESEGLPLFIIELVRRLQEEPASGPPHLERALLARAGRVSVPAREMLELACVAARPVPAEVLRAALRQSPEQFSRCAAELRGARLIRSSDRGWLSPYQDRIRQAVMGELSRSDRVAHHRCIAAALETHAWSDAGDLAEHYLASGADERALPHLIAAARSAASQLAYDRADMRYAQAIANPHCPPTEVRRLKVERAHALAASGRGREAAELYLQAIEGAEVADALDLRRRAAHHLLRSGEVERGVQQARALMREAHLSMPRTAGRALLRLIWHRIRIGMRGLEFQPVPRSKVDPELLSRMELLWSIAPALGWVDVMIGSELHARHLRLALASGDIQNVLRAYVMEASLMLVTRPRQVQKAKDLLEKCEQLRQGLEDPELDGLVHWMRGNAAQLELDMAAAERMHMRAEHIFRERCLESSWELTNARSLLLAVKLYRGDFRSLVSLSRQWLREAQERDDRHAQTLLICQGSAWLPHVLADQPDRALEQIDATAAVWPDTTFQLPQVMRVMARTGVLLYKGGTEAYEFLLGRWPDLERSKLLHSAFLRSNLLFMRARAAVGAALVSEGAERKGWVKLALADSAEVVELGLPGAAAFSHDVRSLAFALSGRREAAVSSARFALGRYSELGIVSFAEQVRYVLGLLTRGPAGRALRDQALGWAHAQGIREPERFFGAEGLRRAL